ncbi:MAG: HDOD domain-containing protein [Pseudomonadota bacterium]|nr:HDOD domain-containing protein [Pseudomonadota bacterium]MDP2352417.1 HDOD domain-containing protein [Pseudomonadota bacterium]
MTPQSLAKEATTLFTLPDVVLRANAVMASPKGTSHELVKVIEVDAGLTARVLRLANSILYGYFGRVENLTHALAIVGHNALRDLVLASAAVKTFQNIPAEFVDMDTFWDNSITCAVLTQQIARRLRLPESESLFISGLLHGVGRLVFYARRPNEYRMALQLAHGGELDLTTAERSIFGFTYAELGAALLTAWGLPRKLCLAVEYQLEPDQAPGHQKEAALLHLANAMTTRLAPCLKTREQPEPFSPDLISFAAKLGLSQADLEQLQLSALSASIEIIEIIHPNATTLY